MKYVYLLSLSFFVSLSAFAQIGAGIPLIPQDNKCYALCTTQDEYKTETENVLIKPAYKTLTIIPAEYKTITEEVIVKPASKKFVYVPATYKTVTDTIWTKEGYTKLTKIPSKFSDDIKTVETKASIERYVASGQRVPNCDSTNPNDCQIVCAKTFPAEYKTVPVVNKVKDETVSKSPVKGVFTIVSRQVEVTPARYNTIDIPETKKTITKSVLVKDEETRETEVPAEYTTIQKQVLSKRGGLQEWKEVSCEVADVPSPLPINYATGSAALTTTSKRIIDDRLLTLMNAQPNAKVEIDSHTDARGSKSANHDLSQRRAQSVVNYLVSRGVSRSRLIAKGYGEEKPLNRCTDGVSCSAAEYAVNRRTEFKVL